MKPCVDMSLPGIGEDFSHLDMIIAELPELFYAEIFPKLDLKDTCNLARVNKAYNDAVWSVDGVRSMKAKMDTYNDLNPYRYPAFERIPHIHVAPIYWAVWHRNVPAVKALLKSGVDVNKPLVSFTRDKVTPLYYAAVEGHLSIVTLLLDAGANVREPDDWGVSPLKAARKRGHENIVELLKAAGA